MMGDESSNLIAEAYHFLATSDAAAARALRRIYWGVDKLSIPAPRAVFKPMLAGYLAARSVFHFGKRVFFCQPMFAAYCKSVGENLRVGEIFPYVAGNGDIIIGDDVILDGRVSITFASRFSEHPTLQIGDRSGIGHMTELTIGKRITIGRSCILSGGIRIFDSNGHPSDPEERRALKPPPPDQVRPVTIGDDVWIGKGCMIFPGVHVGDCAIISGGSVVRRHVPAYAVVAGNPAQIVYRLPRPKEPPPSRRSSPAEP